MAVAPQPTPRARQAAFALAPSQVDRAIAGVLGYLAAMATANDLRHIALSLEGTVEAPHMDRTAFKVARTYATLPPDGLSANLMLSLDEQEFRCERSPAAYAPVAGGWGRMGFTTLTLSALALDELREVLTIAWRMAQPKPRRSTKKR